MNSRPGLFKNEISHRYKSFKRRQSTPTCKRQSSSTFKPTKIRRFGPTKLDQVRERLRKVSQELKTISTEPSANKAPVTETPANQTPVRTTPSEDLEDDRSSWQFSEPIPTVERCPRSDDSVPTFGSLIPKAAKVNLR